MPKIKKSMRYPKRMLSAKHPVMRGASVTLVLETERQLKNMLKDESTDPALKERLLNTSVRLISSMNTIAAANYDILHPKVPPPKGEDAQEDEEPSAFQDWKPEKLDTEEEEEEDE